MTINKMLIDASHPEETRVVVLRDGRVEEFDYESTAREQLRGNIYLAKVTRVEPSLQAAFVDYGGNRHGFLAFSEIHPDYYQIPVADRQALLEEEAVEQKRDAAEDDDSDTNGASSDAEASSKDESEDQASLEAEAEAEDAGGAASGSGADGEEEDEAAASSDASVEAAPEAAPKAGKKRGRSLAEKFLAPIFSGDYLAPSADSDDAEPADDFSDAPEPHGLVEDSGVVEVNGGDDLEAEAASNGADQAESVDEIGEGDALEEVPVRRRRKKRYYKIQEVIKRGQIILVQVVKEERGNKGAALTTYMSLAGRFTVLMPNTARGGGISRKITNATDRSHLRKIANALEVPEGMGLIIRTAGASRTKLQINRDFEYLLRLWEKVRDLTLTSIAPCRVYEEGDLIKRSIRDLYSKDIDQVVVSGEKSYREAKDFMRMIMPSHAKNVKQYKDNKPLFIKYDIEQQLAAMFSPYVTLKSGGYLVINQTEALVAIDINSGKSTREFSIEETALKTNLEASEEIARQLKLRDLAGLIVIDYIDMEERSNNRAVERRLKNSLQGDRARIQVGRISHFGLLEMSRQRLRTGVLEGSTSQCTQCQGTGIIRSTDSVALSVIRALEDVLISGETGSLRANTSVDVALYILNSKRESLNEIEQRYNVEIDISADEKLQGGNFSIETVGSAENGVAAGKVIMTMNWGAGAPDAGTGGRGRGDGKTRKRGGRKRGKDAAGTGRAKAPGRARKAKSPNTRVADEKAADTTDAKVSEAAETSEGGEDGQAAKKPRRRGRRGGRRSRGRRGAGEAGENDAQMADTPNASGEGSAQTEAQTDVPAKPKARSGAKSTDKTDGDDTGEAKAATPKPRRAASGRKPGRPRKAAGNGDATSEASDPTAAAPKAAASKTAAAKKSARASSDDKGTSTPKPGTKSGGKKPAAKKTAGRAKPVKAETASAATAGSDSDGPAKSGWWQRRE